MRLAIFDKDGTLIKPRSGQTFVQSPDDQELLPGVKEQIEAMAKDGWEFAIASNQGGVAAGHKTLESAIAEMRFCMELLPIYEAWFCPDFDGRECYMLAGGEVNPSHQSLPEQSGLFRKPNPGMLKAAISFWMPWSDPLTSDQIIMVGDRPEDEQAAASAGVGFIWADQWRVSGVRSAVVG